MMWDEEAAADLGVTYAEPEEIFAEADFISLHLPSTPETYKFVNAALLERMKPSAFIVNTARGSLVDEEALVAAIDAGQLAGAASDVVSVEPPPADHPFLNHPKILPFPHVAGVTQESVHAMVVMAFSSASSTSSKANARHIPTTNKPSMRPCRSEAVPRRLSG